MYSRSEFFALLFPKRSRAVKFLKFHFFVCVCVCVSLRHLGCWGRKGRMLPCWFLEYFSGFVFSTPWTEQLTIRDNLLCLYICMTDTEEKFHSLSEGIIIIATCKHIDVYTHILGASPYLS